MPDKYINGFQSIEYNNKTANWLHVSTFSGEANSLDE